MLSTISATTSSSTASTTTVRIKSLDSRLVHDEEKDLEQESQDLESEEVANNEPEEEEQSASELEAEQSSYSGLSSRASDIKEYLRERTAVKAVLLKQDGSTEEISYDASSSSTRSLLGGRPSIIGEIEELQLVVVQSVGHSMSSGLNENKHTLPVPLCHHRGSGDLVLFRVDSGGRAGDVSLSEYQKYVDDHKTLTATAVKNHSNDNEPIRSNSPFDSTAKMSMESLRGALQTQLYSESSSADVCSASLDEAVQQRLQEMVDQMVQELSGSPLDDPDYSPSDEMMNSEADLVVVGSGFEALEGIDERPWRAQLEGALEHVREIGRVHAEAFAERMVSTICELNGSEPTLDELTSLYSRIRTDFANEAEEELDDESEAESEAETESESEIESEEEVEVSDSEWESALSLVQRVGAADGAVLAEALCDLLHSEYGEEPSLSQLSSIWQSVHEEVAAEAAESDDEEDSDYDPSNDDDLFVAELDAAESEQHEAVHFGERSEGDDDTDGDDGEWEEALDHIRAIAKEDGCALAEQICSVYVEQNGHEMSLEELQAVWQWVEEGLSAESLEAGDLEADYDPENEHDREQADLDEDEDDEHEASHFDQILLNTPMVSSRRGGAVSFSVYFDERDLSEEAESSNLVKTARAFESMHQRPPTTLELLRMKQFLSVPNELVDEEEEQSMTESMKQIDSAQPRAPSKVLVSPVAEKKAAKRFNVYLEHSKLSQTESEQTAIQWFSRFNRREPNDEELSKIKAFVQKDAQLTEQEFLVPVQSLDFDAVHDDDAKQSELPPPSTTKAVVTKQRATGYTLSFDDDAELHHDGDEEQAIKWFERFNNRQPAQDELEQIRKFMEADKSGDDEEMLDIE